MTTNDEPLSAYRPSYVAGLERRVEKLEAENRDLNEQIALKIWHDVGQALPEHAYLVQEALKAEERLKEARAEVAEQREAIAKALEALEMVEWVSDFDFDRDDPDQAYYFFYTWCPWCKQQHDKGHADDCPREAALAGLRAGLQNIEGAK